MDRMTTAVFESVASEWAHEHSQVATLPRPKALGDKDAG